MHAPRVRVSARMGVAVRRLTKPIQRGASSSSTNISASRDGTINVPLRAVMIAIIAPNVTNIAAPTGRYTEATSAIGALVDCNRAPGNTPNDTIDVNT